MSENKKDMTQSQLNTIKKSTDSANEILSSLSSLVYNTKPDASDDELLKNDKETNQLFEKINKAGSNDLIGALEQISRKSSVEDRKKIENIKSTIQNNKDLDTFQSLLFSDDSSNINKFEDLLLLSSIVPQLIEVKKAFRDNILSPDDATKQISMDIKIDNKIIDLSQNQYNNIKKVLENKKYKITKHLKEIIDGSLVYGKHYVAVLPYKTVFEKRIKKKMENANYYNNNNPSKLKEAYEENIHAINRAKSAPRACEEDINIDPLSGILSESEISAIKNIEFDNKQMTAQEKEEFFVEKADSVLLQDACDFVPLDLLSETTMKDNKSFEKYINIANKLHAEQNKIDTKDTSTSSGMYETQSKNINIDINGAYIRELDIRNVIPLKINDVCLGYYYVESMQDLNIIRNPGRFRMRANKISAVQKTQAGNNNVENAYKALSSLVMKKLDKKFIEDNAQIKEKIYDILRYREFLDSDIRVTFFTEDEVQEFEINDGKSIFEQSLFFSKLYLSLLLSTIMMKVSRANDIRAYYVKTDAQGGVASLTQNAIGDIKKSQRNITSLSNVVNILKQFTCFDDIFLPKTQNDDKPIDFDVIQGQSVNDNTDLMEQLLGIIVDSTGCPLALISNSNEVDFSKTYTMLNLKFLRRVVVYQSEINMGITEFLLKILKTELSEDEYNKISNTFTASLQSPVNLTLSNALDLINNLSDFSTKMASIVLGDSNQDDKLRDAFIFEVCKIKAPSLALDSYKEIMKQVQLKLKQREVEEKASESDSESEV